ncbi:hypothetical protein SmJEL517_g01761 [Synchytrium microbalum]|uniref:Uncharacterized protein n=1 Tax=Synchytrium microbalum TaxID=1806994 RepID=A0A507C340_9FUNG|nr:uncharacterized protein SmJEL517_g01761 [Synchytrium microbalum]TPX35930.1 hypothetical protein SmJEL517_g01761 [Synchytrium microbalum]
MPFRKDLVERRVSFYVGSQPKQPTSNALAEDEQTDGRSNKTRRMQDQRRKSITVKRPLTSSKIREISLSTQWLPVQPLQTLQDQAAANSELANNSSSAHSELANNGSSAHSTSSLILQFGLYQVKYVPFQQKGLKSVIDLPTKKYRGSATVSTLDAKGICLWNNAMSHLVSRVAFASKIRSNREGLQAFSKWTYSSVAECFIVGGDSPDLRVLDLDFVERASIVTNRNILCLLYIESRNEVVAGEIGGIHVYSLIKRISKSKNATFDLRVRLDIRDLRADDWVSNVAYDETLLKLFGMSETGIIIYDMELGIRTHTLKLEPLEVGVSVAFYPPLEYLVTGSRDGRVRVWNSRLKPLHELRGHTHQISSLALMEKTDVSPSSWGTLPVCISSSWDGSIRLWQIETGECLQRIDVGQPVLQMSFMSPDVLVSVTDDAIQHFGIGRHRLFFSQLGSTPTILRRINSLPPRILCATVDGAIRFISPVSGQTLSIGFPSLANVVFTSLEYDPTRRRIYAFSSQSCFVYSVATNPMTIVAELKTSPDHTVFCGVFNSYNQTYFELLSGSRDGKIERLDVDANFQSQRLALAHAGPLSILTFDSTNNHLVSYGSDLAIKIWEPVMSQSKDGISSISGLSLLQVVSLPISLTSRISCLNPATKSIICEIHGHLNVFGLTPENQEKLVLQDHATTLPSKAVDCLSLYGCYASVSEDGAVKVWDHSDGSMVREVQIGAKSQTMCFANERGDLLVGTEQGISIVRCQEYMPPHLIRKILDLGPKDDSLESLFPFSDDADLWHYIEEREVYESSGRVSKVGSSSQWSRPSSATPLSSSSCRLPTRRELQHRRMRETNEAEFINRETAVFRRGQSLGLPNPFTEANPAHSWQINNENPTRDVDTIMVENVELGVSTTDLCVEVDVVSEERPTSAAATISRHSVVQAAFADPEYSLDPTLPTATVSTKIASRVKPRKKMTKEQIAETHKRREALRLALQRQGYNLPNSLALERGVASATTRGRPGYQRPIRAHQDPDAILQWEDEQFEMKPLFNDDLGSEYEEDDGGDTDSSNSSEGTPSEASEDSNKVERRVPVLPPIQAPTTQASISNNEVAPTIAFVVNGRDSTLEPLTKVDQKAAEAYTWDLMKQADLTGKNRDETLHKVTEQSWFPGLGSLAFTLFNIIKVVVQVLLHADKWEDRCEASKALLYLSATFRDDVKDPVREFIQPTLEAMADESTHWKVRATCCAHILAFGIWSAEVIAALIGRLQDSEEKVREIAVKALIKIGINTTDALRATLERLGARHLNPNLDICSTYVPLDILLAKISREKLDHKLDETNPDVERWIRTVPDFSPTGLSRQASYYEHLAGYFFKDDKRQVILPEYLTSSATYRSSARGREDETAGLNAQPLSRPETAYVLSRPGTQSDIVRVMKATGPSRPSTARFSRPGTAFTGCSTSSSRATTAKALSRPTTRENHRPFSPDWSAKYHPSAIERRESGFIM